MRIIIQKIVKIKVKKKKINLLILINMHYKIQKIFKIFNNNKKIKMKHKNQIKKNLINKIPVGQVNHKIQNPKNPNLNNKAKKAKKKIEIYKIYKNNKNN